MRRWVPCPPRPLPTTAQPAWQCLRFRFADVVRCFPSRFYSQSHRRPVHSSSASLALSEVIFENIHLLSSPIELYHILQCVLQGGPPLRAADRRSLSMAALPAWQRPRQAVTGAYSVVQNAAAGLSLLLMDERLQKKLHSSGCCLQAKGILELVSKKQKQDRVGPHSDLRDSFGTY